MSLSSRERLLSLYEELYWALENHNQAIINIKPEGELSPSPDEYFDFYFKAFQALYPKTSSCPKDIPQEIAVIFYKIRGLALNKSIDEYNHFIGNFRDHPLFDSLYKEYLQSQYNDKKNNQLLGEEPLKKYGFSAFVDNLVELSERLITAEILYQLNSLANEFCAEEPETLMEMAANELVKEAMDLLLTQLKKLALANKEENPDKRELVLKDLRDLSHTLDAAYEVMADPSDKNKLDRLTENANQIAGKPSIWNKVLGAVFCVVGAVLIGLCLAGTFHSGGFSLFGVPIGKKVIAVGIGLISGTLAIGFFASGRRKGLSKAAINVADIAETTKAPKAKS